MTFDNKLQKTQPKATANKEKQDDKHVIPNNITANNYCSEDEHNINSQKVADAFSASISDITLEALVDQLTSDHQLENDFPDANEQESKFLEKLEEVENENLFRLMNQNLLELGCVNSCFNNSKNCAMQALYAWQGRHF